MEQFSEYLESIQDAQKIEKIIRFNIEAKKDVDTFEKIINFTL